MFHVVGLDHVALTVRDRERSLEWYQRVLGMEQRYQDIWNGPHDPIMVCSGDMCLALFSPDTADPLPAPDHNVIAMRHFALRLDRRNFERAQVEPGTLHRRAVTAPTVLLQYRLDVFAEGDRRLSIRRRHTAVEASCR